MEHWLDEVISSGEPQRSLYDRESLLIEQVGRIGLLAAGAGEDSESDQSEGLAIDDDPGWIDVDSEQLAHLMKKTTVVNYGTKVVSVTRSKTTQR